LNDVSIDKLEEKYGVKVNYIQTKLKWWAELKFIKTLKF
jgi:hypothetical protein